MAIIKSAWIIGQQTTKRPQTTGAIHVTHFVYDFGSVASKALAAGDILELGIIPVNSRITEARLLTEGTFTGLTADIGIMSGVVGDDTNPDGSARTSGNELFAAADLTVPMASLSKPNVLLLTPSELERSIGVKVSGAVAKAAGKKIHLQLFYYQ